MHPSDHCRSLCESLQTSRSRTPRVGTAALHPPVYRASFPCNLAMVERFDFWRWRTRYTTTTCRTLSPWGHGGGEVLQRGVGECRRDPVEAQAPALRNVLRALDRT